MKRYVNYAGNIRDDSRECVKFVHLCDNGRTHAAISAACAFPVFWDLFVPGEFDEVRDDSHLYQDMYERK